jgi:uncharacterized iron-regulated membrane protein
MAQEQDRLEPTRGRLYALLWRWHFLAALIVIPFVLWQSVTGTLYLWSEWWMDVSHPELRFVQPAARQARPSAQIAAALAAVPKIPAVAARAGHVHPAAPRDRTAAGPTPPAMAAEPSVQAIMISDDPRRSTVVLLRTASGIPYPVFVDPHEARLLGTLGAVEWLPGLSRALHGGWPLGKPGSWLLELGDGWAIVMILSGLYLWWPRGRRFPAALWPRFHAGPRVVLRDLHASVAVLFSAVFLFFLISALPWTAFWGGELLSRVQDATGQANPAGFSIGGASASRLAAASAALDDIVATARARSVGGTLDIRLAPEPDAPFFVTTLDDAATDRTLLGDAKSGTMIGDFGERDLPVIPRLVALGVHVHQADFGPLNRWLNTAFALSLIWLSITGVLSWWIRRPRGSLGIPEKVHVRWPRSWLLVAGTMCVLLPIFGASVVVAAAIDRIARWVSRPA